MKKYKGTNLFLLIIITVIFIGLANAQDSIELEDYLKIYPAPIGAKRANEYRVFINGKEAFVYANPVAAYTYFDFEGKADIEVRPVRDVKWVDIRPLSYHIESNWKGGSIYFTLEKNCNISVEINKNTNIPLFIFANPKESDIPNRNDKDVIFYETGKIHVVGNVELKSNQTVYIEGGAIVKGAFSSTNKENIVIHGRGILDGLGKRGPNIDSYKWTHLISLIKSKNIEVRDIILHNCDSWQVVPLMSEHVLISNIKLISGNPSDDGIDIVSSSNVFVDGCFIRTKDDCVVIKAFLPDSNKESNSQPRDKNSLARLLSEHGKNLDVNNIVVQNCVFWNAEWGNGIEIGFELEAEKVQNITFRNIDVIHVDNGAVFSIHNGGNSIVSDVLFENIRIENPSDKLFDLAIFRTLFSIDKPKTTEQAKQLYIHGAWDNVIEVPKQDSAYHAQFRGWIRDITFRDIRVIDGQFPYSVISGFDKNHLVENIIIDGLWIHGRRINNLDEARFHIENARNIKLK